MSQQPHGWAPTKSLSLLHYFGISRDGQVAYRPDGTPIALCHNALRASENHSLAREIPKDSTAHVCPNCEGRVPLARKSWRIRQDLAAEKTLPTTLQNDTDVRVTRGAYAGATGTIGSASSEAEGFYWVWIATGKQQGAKKVLLSKGQLEPITK